MAKGNLITAERLREVFHYDPETGLFTRIEQRSGRGKVGDVVGYKDASGHLYAMADYQKYAVHRLAFLYMTGEWPKGQVDHMNGVRDDNRWVNLRDVTHTINAQNRTRAKRGKKNDLPLGVFKTLEGRFRSVCRVMGKNHHLGTFPTIAEAEMTYLSFRRLFVEGNTL